MRDDMYKVIVERPRRGWHVQGDGRTFRASEERPAKIGVKRGYKETKELNENLAPLRRWLASQVNRPWDRVYADLCSGIDRRNTVQAHIFTHVEDFVAIRTEWRAGEVYVRRHWRWGEIAPIRETGFELYVHPASGLLLANRHRVGRNAKRQAQAESAKAKRESVRRVIDAHTQLHWLDIAWFELEIGELAPGEERWDAVRKEFVSIKRNAHDNENMFGGPRRYALSKRQLSKAALRRYRLEPLDKNGALGRRFCLQREDVGLGCAKRISVPIDLTRDTSTFGVTANVPMCAKSAKASYGTVFLRCGVITSAPGDAQISV